MDEIKIECPEIFDFDKCLDYLRRDENEVLFEVENHTIYRAIDIDGEQILICIIYHHHYLIVKTLNNTVTNPILIEKIIAYIEEWFDFSTDLSTFYQYARENEILNPLIHELYGLRLIRIPELFEAISWGIIGQQINLTFAYQLKKRLVQSYGEKITYHHKAYYIHPTPEVIANVSVQELMDLKFSRRKAEYLIEVAKRMHSQMLSKQMLLDMKDANETERALTKIRGIGPWTAHYVMMRALGIKNAFPIGDIGLQNALKFILNLDEKPSKAQMLSLNESWHEWSSYATFYIWRAPHNK